MGLAVSPHLKFLLINNSCRARSLPKYKTWHQSLCVFVFLRAKTDATPPRETNQRLIVPRVCHWLKPIQVLSLYLWIALAFNVIFSDKEISTPTDFISVCIHHCESPTKLRLLIKRNCSVGNTKKRHKKGVSYFHRTATTTYPCSVPVLGDSAGAGRERLTPPQK